MSKHRIEIRVNEAMKRWLLKMAAKRGVSLSDLVKAKVVAGLKHGGEQPPKGI
jgi:hypothetical protein